MAHVHVVASAVIGEITSRAISKEIKKFNRHPAVDEKLRRLEMLLITIHRAVEASEKYHVENPSLLQWKEKLKEAASHGDEVLDGFRHRATDMEAAKKANQQQLGSSTSGALSFARMALPAMVQRIRDAAKMLFSGDDDMDKQDDMVERLEKMSADTGEFVTLLQLGGLPKVKKRPDKRMTKPATYAGTATATAELQGPVRRKRPFQSTFQSMLDSSMMLETARKAAHPVGSVTSVVVGEITNRAVSKVIKKFDKQSAADEKLQQLEMQLIKIHSMVEASEKHLIKNSWLLKWQQKLKEAASQGDEVLLSFKQRAMDVEAARNVSHQPGNASGALYFTRTALSAMANCIRKATTALFSSDEDMEKLNGAVERLEKVSADSGKFLRLLHQEALQKLSLKPDKMKRTCSKPELPTRSDLKEEGTVQLKPLPETEQKSRKWRKIEVSLSLAGTPTGESPYSYWKMSALASGSLSKAQLQPMERMEATMNEISNLTVTETADDIEDQELRMVERLEKALAKVAKAIEIADGQDMKGLEWTAQWTTVFREAMERGWTVISTINKNDKEMVHSDSADEFYSLLHAVESLAGEVEHFSYLVSLSCSHVEG